jgi:hypothetical protein
VVLSETGKIMLALDKKIISVNKPLLSLAAGIYVSSSLGGIAPPGLHIIVR